MNISTVNELIQSLESAGELSIKERKYLELAKAYQQLAAENVALNEKLDKLALWPGIEFYSSSWEFNNNDGNEAIEFMCDIETPATDRIVAGIKADGRVEGINFAASRLAAAFNHGFVDKPLAEVFDVVRMILTAKEDLANDPVLAADGLSGEYAEKSLAEWEAELREGAK
ncbi:TPA: hypothetical protein I8622_002101 [Klebsiella oxytoca]|nr:hypothetical protein [Klebsiella oxytoca]